MRCGYIYKITNKLDGTVYIGKRGKSELDIKYWGSGFHITRAIKKYGVENFTREIIDWAETKEELNEKEIFWIAFVRNHYERCYNITAGGEGHRAHLTEEHKQRLREFNLGRHHTNEAKEKNRQASLLMWQDPNHRLKWDHTAWNKGLHNIYREESIKSNSDKHKKLWGNPEYRKHVEEGHKKVHQATRSKRVVAVNYVTKEVVLFNSKVQCCNYFNCQTLHFGIVRKYGKMKNWVLKYIED